MLLGQRTRTGLLLITLVGLFGADDPAPVSPSRCPQPSQADRFLRAFAPPATGDEMRATSLEQDEQVRLAYGAIDFIEHHPSQPAATKVGEGKYGDDGSPELDAWRIANFNDTIQEYVDSNTRFAVALASLGRASDAPQIGRLLTPALNVARQDGLMGHEKSAIEAQGIIKKVITNFSNAFAGDCQNQNVKVVFVLELERQNQLLGTGISVIHCAQRKYTADLDSQGVHYHFETCTFDGSDHWDLTVKGLVTGSGYGAPGHEEIGFWNADTVFQGHADVLQGSLRLTTESTELPPSSSPPNPASPTAQPNDCPVEKPPDPPQPKIKLVHKLAIHPIHLLTGPTGKLGYGGGFFTGEWLEAEITMKDGKACGL